MNVLDMTISRVSRISMALSLMLLASWVWFNFLTQPQAMNLFVSSPSMFQKISLGNMRLPGSAGLQDGSSIAELPLLSGTQLQARQIDGIEVVGSALETANELAGQANVTNFSGAAIEGGPAPLLPSAQRQNIQIADLPFLITAPPLDNGSEDEQIVIAAPSGRLTVNPFAPIYVEEEEPQRRNPVVNNSSGNSAASANSNRTASQARAAAEPVEEPLVPKVAIGTVPTPRPLLPPPAAQSKLPASFGTVSLAANPSLLRAPIRSNYYDASEVPEPVVIEIPAEVVEAEVVAEPVKLDRSRLTGVRMPVNGGSNAQPALSQSVNSRSYSPNANNSEANANQTAGLPPVNQAPANPKVTIGLPQASALRSSIAVPTLQPIGLKQAQLIGRRNVPVVEAPEPVEVVEEVVVPQVRPVQIALRVPEPVVQEPVMPVPVVQEVPEPVVEEPIVEEPVVEEVDVVEIPTSQPYIASVSSTLDLAQPTLDTTTIQATAAAQPSTATPSDVAGASVVAKFVKDNNISFTGAILGPVSVAIFEGRMGSFHVPIGENIPDTEIRLTNVKRHEVELRQGSESHIIYLDLGQ